MQNNYKDLTLPKISNKPLVTSYCNNIAAGRCKHSFTCLKKSELWTVHFQ